MFEARVCSTFTASHQLRYPDGQLEAPHSHDWNVSVAVAADKLDAAGLVVDFHILHHGVEAALRGLRGVSLNEHPVFTHHNPSAENVARHIAERVQTSLPEGVRVAWVEVEEEAGCFARYLPPAAGN